MKFRVLERFGKKKIEGKPEEKRDEILVCQHEGVFVYFVDTKYEGVNFRKNKREYRFLFHIVNFTKQEVTVQMDDPCIDCKTIEDYTMSTTIHKLSHRYAEASIYMDEPIHDRSFIEFNFRIYHQDYEHDTSNIGKRQWKMVMDQSYPLVDGTFNDLDVMKSEEFIHMVDRYIPHEYDFTMPQNVASYIDVILEELDGEPVEIVPKKGKER